MKSKFALPALGHGRFLACTIVAFILFASACWPLLPGVEGNLKNIVFTTLGTKDATFLDREETLQLTAQLLRSNVQELVSSVENAMRLDKMFDTGHQLLVEELEHAEYELKEAMQQMRNKSHQISSNQDNVTSSLAVASPQLKNPNNGTLCEYPFEQLLVLLSWPHGDGSLGPGSRRYFVRNAWRDIGDAVESIQNQGQKVWCIIVAARNTLPCYEEECFFQLYARPGTTDTDVLRQVIDYAEYDFVREYKHVNTILDAGGNIGLASLLFGIRWPAARIITIEPSSDTYKQLLANVGSMPNVTPIHAGLWSKNTKLVFGPNPNGAWGVNVIEADEKSTEEQLANGITSVTIPYLMDLFVLDAFDFIKIDIEGAEENLLSEAGHNDLGWVNMSKLISVEFHHNVEGGVKRAYEFLHSHPRFSASSHGEYKVFARND